MPQVGVQQPTNLMEMYSSASPMLWDIANQQVQDQTLGNLINRQQAQQGMDFAAQEQPFKLSRLGLENQGLEADLPGRVAQSSLAQDKATLSRNTLSEQQRAQLSDLAAKVSNNDLLEAENAVKTALTHPSAAVREAANQMWQNLSHIKEAKMKQDQETARALELSRQQGQNQKDVMQMQIDAGRFKKNDKYGISLAQKIDSENDPGKKQALLIDAAQQAAREGDMENAQYYSARAQALDNAVKLQRNANPKPGAVDIGQVGGVPVNATPSAMPDTSPSTPTKSLNFPSEAEAEAAVKRGQLKSGDIIIINGRKARVP